MTLPLPLRLMGAPGSPCTRKMRGPLRYRRIAHEVMQMGGLEAKDLPRARRPLAPTFFLPDEAGELVGGTYKTDIRKCVRYAERSSRCAGGRTPPRGGPVGA